MVIRPVRTPAVGIAVALVVLAVILPTVMPGVGFWDTGEFQTVGPVFGTAHPTGFPAYVTLGWLASMVLAPIGEPAFRMNALSAILVAAAAGLTVGLVRQLTGSTVVAAAAGLGLGLTPLAWRIGTAADAHALHLPLVALLFLLLVRWEDARRAERGGADRWLLAAAFVFGIAAANHSLTLLLAPPIGLFLLAVEPGIVRRGRLIAACVAVLAATLVVLYLQLPLRAGVFPAPLVYGRPDTLEGFQYVVLAEQFRGSVIDPFGRLDAKAAALVGLLGRQYAELAILLPIGFVVTLWRRPAYAVLSGWAFAITAFFSASYQNADIERYYLVPVLIGWTWIGLLAATLLDLLGERLAARGELDGSAPGPSRRTLAGDVPFAVGTAALAMALVAPTIVALPDRAERLDRSTDVAAERWLDRTLEALDQDAVVVSWWSYSTPLWYAQHVEGRRRDVFVVDDRTRLDLELGDVSDVIDRFLGTRPVYLIRVSEREVDALRDRYVIRPGGSGQLYRVESRVEAAT